MERFTTPEDIVGRQRSLLELDVWCAPCGAVARVRVPWVTIDPRARRGVDTGWDGVALGAIFTCAACGAVDAYEVSEASYAELLREKGTRSGTRVIEGVTRLWDGSEPRRAAEGLARLRALTEARPESAEAWRRLGNACERYELRDEALRAWVRGAAASDDEFESAYSAAAELFRSETEEIPREASRLLQLAVKRFADPAACPADRRLEFGRAIAALLFELADAADHPVVLLASWHGGGSDETPFVHVSSAELGRLRRRDMLGPFLAREDLFALEATNHRQSEERTNLEVLLDAATASEGQRIERYLASAGEIKTPVRVEARPGRNEACPCGSGKKYKRCHGR